MNTLPETRDENGYQLLWLAAWLVLLIVGFAVKRERQRKRSRLCRLGRGCSVAPKWVLPVRWSFFRCRAVCCVLLLVCSEPAARGGRGAVCDSADSRFAVFFCAAAGILLGVMVLSIVYTVDVSAHYYRVNQRLAAFDALIAQVPRGKQVLPLMSQLVIRTARSTVSTSGEAICRFAKAAT